MTEYSVREYTPVELPEIVSLWGRVFGDDEPTAMAVLSALPGIGTAVTAEAEGRVAGFALCLTGQEVQFGDGQKDLTVGYIYAVAVDEKYRHQGIGAALVRAAAQKARERGADVICTLPAEESLYRWYEELLGVKCALRRRRTETAAAGTAQAERLTADGYAQRREGLLRGRNRLALSERAMEAACEFYEALGGGMYARGGGIAAGYPENGTAYLKEILAEPTELSETASAAARAMGAEKAVFFTPDDGGSPYIAADRPLPADCVWSFSFD